MKAEEKTVASVFFSVVMQFVYSLGKKQKQQQQQNKTKKKQKKKNLGEGGGRGRGTRAEGQVLVADDRELQ